jgi:hypothetical protein
MIARRRRARIPGISGTQVVARLPAAASTFAGPIGAPASPQVTRERHRSARPSFSRISTWAPPGALDRPPSPRGSSWRKRSNPESHSRGREFDPPRLHQSIQKTSPRHRPRLFSFPGATAHPPLGSDDVPQVLRPVDVPPAAGVRQPGLGQASLGVSGPVAWLYSSDAGKSGAHPWSSAVKKERAGVRRPVRAIGKAGSTARRRER